MRKKSFLFFALLLLTALVFAVACDTADSTAPTTTVTSTDGPASPTVDNPLNLLTFNLRYKTTGHPCYSLDVRGPNLIEIVKKYDPDSLSFCEATNDWMNFLRPEMEKLGYACIGVGRDQGTTGGTGSGNEHSPIFYKSDKYECLESDTFWLSATPEAVGSKSWNSSMKRICTYVVLKNKETQVVYAHFGTHFDTRGDEVRQGSAWVIESYIRQVLDKYGDIGIVVSGDFNTGMESSSYRMLTSFLDDARVIAKRKLVVGSTMNYYNADAWESKYGGNKKPTVESSSPIDYIFFGKNTASVSLYTVVNDTFTFEADGRTWHDHPVSDHYGVFCQVNLNAPVSTITYDHSQNISYLGSLAPSETLPAEFEALRSVNDRFSISSTLKVTSSLDNLLKNDASVAAASVDGTRHGVWEIKFSAESPVGISGLSFTTGSVKRKLPGIVRIYLSEDGTDWKQWGGVYDEDLSPSTTYYMSHPIPKVRAKYIKLVFSDCHQLAELANVTIYSE